MFRDTFASVCASVTAFALILGASPQAFAAGDSSFRLEDHIPADFHRRYLSLEPRIDWNRDRNEDGFGMSQGISAMDRMQANLRLTYGSERFTQAFSWKLSHGAGLGWNGDDNTSRNRSLNSFGPYWTGSVQEESRFDYTVFSRISAQWYATDRIFLSPSWEGDIYHNPSRSSQGRVWQLYNSDPDDSLEFTGSRNSNRASNFNTDFNARLALGYGRIQNVRFAETALFLLDRLSGTLGRAVAFDARTMRDLEARLEARRKQRPFYDRRMAAIYDMESVLEFLKETRPDDSISHRAVLEMADEWNYPGWHERRSGWEVRAFPFAGYKWNETHSRNRRTSYSISAPPGWPADEAALERAAMAAAGPDTVRKERGYHGTATLGAGLSAAYQRPWRRFYQFEASAFSRLSRVEEEHGSRPSAEYATGIDRSVQYLNYAYPMLEMGYIASVSWYPSSRTSVTGYLNGYLKRKWDYLEGRCGLAEFDSAGFSLFHFGYSQSVGVRADYFLGPRLVLRAGLEERSNWYRTRDEINGAPWEYGSPIDRQRTWSTRWVANTGLIYYLF